jgi:putrescine transport system ATP-binding protein
VYKQHETIAVNTEAKSAPIGHGRPWMDPTIEPFIRVEGVSKHFGDFAAVDRVDLDIYQGELFSILGGSGSGKTTLLRVLAGFEEPSTGRVVIDGVDMAGIPPHRRPVNMMFQSYALFPHMTVAKNIAYGLKRDGMRKAVISERVADVLDLVQMSDFGPRKPAQLSGGQRQRVALARAIVKRPKVLLLDEPLGALDKKLRESTQFELANIQYKSGITFIVVTHDQEEAMTLSTRIAVMDQGRFPQVGTPTEIYEYPETRFTADFIGTINSFEGSVESVSGSEMSVSLPALDMTLQVPVKNGISNGDTVCLAVRPEKIWISTSPPETADTAVLTGTVEDQGYFGNLSLYRVRLETGEIIQVSAQNRERQSERMIDWDATVHIHWDIASMVLLKE